MVLQASLIALSLAASPDAVHLDYSVVVHLHSDGSITESTSTSVIPLTGQGVHRYSNLSLSFRSGMEEIRIREARTGHWRGGRGSSEASIETGPHSILAGTNRLESSLRETLVSMPGVEVGDTVFISMDRTISELPLSDVYSYTFSPVMEDSVASASFTVINDSDVQLFSSDPRNSFYFPAEPALPDHPLAAYDRHMVSIATGTPSDLSSDASLTLDDPAHAGCSALERIIADTGRSPEALRAWVADNISYIGAEAGVWPGWSPRSPEETLEDHSGVCRDRAVLLMWMLRKAGYEAYPALLDSSGETPAVVDARSFDHMVTVYRNGTSPEWQILDPTPVGLPESAGISFGLRGSTFLPVTPSGDQLHQIPVTGWNDTLDIEMNGDLDASVLTGTLAARASGAPLELLTTLFTRSDPSRREEMFRRFFGAASCTGVSMENGLVVMTGTWDVQVTGEAVLLPGLRDISLPGTRLAAMLLPAHPDSFVPDAPAVESLTLTLPSPWSSPELPPEVSTAGYTSVVTLESGNLILRETADLSAGAEHFTETLFARSGTPARTVVIR